MGVINQTAAAGDDDEYAFEGCITLNEKRGLKSVITPMFDPLQSLAIYYK